ncbi:putative multi-sensor hybrid histidine kinase [Magnetofaba australis IT-1]|uniref:histidine kinase n=2 Tax=Magnetofaba TaxID=1472292 RepID=A0A1Y2JZV9_9PROT|nr:putative multi-sensor hybrid histidine kinase [Magnetofaba australis IT-1]
MSGIFGALTLMLLILVAVISTYYFAHMMERERDRLAVILAQSLADGIQRVSFSGRHHTRLLLEDTVKRNPDIRYIMVVNDQGKIIAHSNPDKNDAWIPRIKPAAVANGDKTQLKSAYRLEQSVHNEVSIITVTLNYRGGYGDQLKGVIQIGISDELTQQAIQQWITFIGLFILAVIFLAMGLIKQASARLGAPIKTLAYQFQSILRHAPMSIVIVDKQGHLVEASESFLKRFQLSNLRAGGKLNPYVKLTADNAQMCTEADKQVLEENKIVELELQLDDAGEKRSFLAIKFPMLHDKNKEVEQICTFAADITERRQAELALSHERSLLRSLIDSIPDVIFFKDPKGRYLGCNKAFEQFCNHTESNLIGKTDVDVFGARIGKEFREQDQIMLRSGVPCRNEEWVSYPDGCRVLMDTLKTPFLGADGEIIGLIGVSRDITDRKRAEEALEHSEQLFRQLAENIDEVFWLVDWITLQPLYISPAFERVWGSSLSAIHDNPRLRFEAIHLRDRERVETHFIGEAAKGDYDCEYTITRADGDTRLIHDRGFPIQDETGRVVRIAGIAEDITEQRRNQEKLEQAIKMAERANRMKADFLAMMSHEIRTPMNAILGMTELMEETSLSQQQKNYLNTQRRASEALLSLIDDILSLSRIEKESQEKTGEALSIYNNNELLGWVESLIAPQINSKGLTVYIQHDDSAPNIMRGRVGALRQILLNLASNAAKFTERGSVTLGATLNEARDTLTYWVADTGPGIPQDKIKHIFEAFTQVATYDTRKHGGTGLGLTIVKRLSEQIGGCIEVKSQEGKGSQFLLRLPWRDEMAVDEKTLGAHDQAQSTFAKTPAQPHKRHTDKTQPLRILLAEDSDDNAMLIKLFLSKEGYKIERARNGREAVALYQEIHPDLILMDLQMPVMDGLEAIRTIRQKECETPADADQKISSATPILALTAHAMNEDRIRCEKAGCDGYLTKPIRKQDLLKAISEQFETQAPNRPPS